MANKKKMRLAKKPSGNFFELTVHKTILFGLIFFVFVYMIVSLNNYTNLSPELIAMNALLWLVLIGIVYSFSCLVLWAFSKVFSR